MPPEPAIPVPVQDDEQPAKRAFLGLLGRHQAAAIISTAVDFSTMVLSVELFHLPPVAGTVAGASCGAITNFQLGRRWIFRALHEGAGPQALRYALVSAASAGLNALGEYVAHNLLGINYILARTVVAVAVSLLWNFPMHRHFVFPHPKHEDQA